MGKKSYQRLELRKFGLSFSLGMLILLIIGFFKNFNFIFMIAITMLLFESFLFALIKPEFLRFQYLFISGLLKFLGLIITNFCLTVFYYLVFTPIAIFLRVMDKDEIKKISIVPNWIEINQEENNPKRIEKLY